MTSDPSAPSPTQAAAPFPPPRLPVEPKSPEEAHTRLGVLKEKAQSIQSQLEDKTYERDDDWEEWATSARTALRYTTTEIRYLKNWITNHRPTITTQERFDAIEKQLTRLEEHLTQTDKNILTLTQLIYRVNDRATGAPL
ncbi:MAG: hypothetical protein KGL39_37785 [Patescibacteria group bacterium]|nr:hypothetical protein [Patescibacteria group bacterium]